MLEQGTAARVQGLGVQALGVLYGFFFFFGWGGGGGGGLAVVFYYGLWLLQLQELQKGAVRTNAGFFLETSNLEPETQNTKP